MKWQEGPEKQGTTKWKGAEMYGVVQVLWDRETPSPPQCKNR